jgi:hypothetical protein
VVAVREALMRRLLAALAVAAVLAGLASIAPVRPIAGACAGAGPNHAALLVQHGDGSVVTRCVAFDGGSITGKELLDASGISWSGQAFGGFGVAVCAVDAEPSTYSSCPGAGHYWALFVERGGGAWQLTPVGVSTLTLADGDGLGVRYVPTAGTPDAPPAAAGACGGAVASGAGGTAAAASSSAVAQSSAPSGSAEVASAGPSSAPAAPGSGSGSGGLDPTIIGVALAVAALGALGVWRMLASRRPAS